jgi:hypothetical protein
VSFCFADMFVADAKKKKKKKKREHWREREHS